MNDFILEAILKEKRENMLHEAARLRMVKEYELSLPSRRDRLMVYIGNLLIRMAEKLHRRYSISGETRTVSWEMRKS